MKRGVRPASGTILLSVSALYWTSMYVYQPIMSVHAERNLGASMAMVGMIVATYGLAQFLLRIPVGIWSDRLGRRKPFLTAGMALTTSGALIMGTTMDPFVMALGRLLVGTGACSWVAFTVLFASYFPPDRSTRALSLIAFVGSAATMIGTFLGGIVADQLGWYAPFFVAAGIGFAGVLASFLIVDVPVPTRKGVSGGDLLRTCTVPTLLAVSAVSSLSTWSQWAVVLTFSPIYAAGHLGASRSDLGLLATAAMASGALFTLAGPYLDEAVGAKTAVAVGILIQALGAVMVPFVRDINLLMISQVMGGGGRGLLFPVTMSMAMKSVGPGDRATAMGVYQAVYALGMFSGPIMSGFLGDAFGLSSVFVAGAVIALAGIPIMARVSER